MALKLPLGVLGMGACLGRAPPAFTGYGSGYEQRLQQAAEEQHRRQAQATTAVQAPFPCYITDDDSQLVSHGRKHLTFREELQNDVDVWLEGVRI